MKHFDLEPKMIPCEKKTLRINITYDESLELYLLEYLILSGFCIYIKYEFIIYMFGS